MSQSRLCARYVSGEVGVVIKSDPLSHRLNVPGKPEEITRGTTGDPSLPVVSVSWYDAVMLCNWLSRQEARETCYRKEGKEQIRDYDNTTREYDAWKLIPGANGYRLPTADEWESACRAGTTTAFSFGDTEELLDRYAVFANNAKGGPVLVGRKLCNAWGLFDMHGNQLEWCQDWYDEGSDRVVRGGSWFFAATFCRTAGRTRYLPSSRDCILGFRVAAVPLEVDASADLNCDCAHPDCPTRREAKRTGGSGHSPRQHRARQTPVTAHAT